MVNAATSDEDCRRPSVSVGKGPPAPAADRTAPSASPAGRRARRLGAPLVQSRAQRRHARPSASGVISRSAVLTPARNAAAEHLPRAPAAAWWSARATRRRRGGPTRGRAAAARRRSARCDGRASRRRATAVLDRRRDVGLHDGVAEVGRVADAQAGGSALAQRLRGRRGPDAAGCSDRAARPRRPGRGPAPRPRPSW